VAANGHTLVADMAAPRMTTARKLPMAIQCAPTQIIAFIWPPFNQSTPRTGGFGLLSLPALGDERVGGA
jgi:hypothetical protein